MAEELMLPQRVGHNVCVLCSLSLPWSLWLPPPQLNPQWIQHPPILSLGAPTSGTALLPGTAQVSHSC